jgi:predicted nucleotidyltransferase
VTAPHVILPTGTQVVTRTALARSGGAERPRGAVGVVVRAPRDHQHGYRVRFPDGDEATLKRVDFAVRRQALREGLEDVLDPMAEHDLYDYVVLRVVIGSRAYDLDEPGSDTDLRGVYLPPAALHWSLVGVPEQLENPEREEVYWELQKFVTLALKANPNILECLYTPRVEFAAPLGEELLEMRDAFLSKLVYQTYSGYVMSQFKKLRRHRENHGEVKPKHVMHLVRLLLSGIEVLERGHLRVEVGEHRDRLLAIRRGEMEWAEVDRWRLALHERFDRAYTQTTLPERPDYARANAFLIRARRSMVEEGR